MVTPQNFQLRTVNWELRNVEREKLAIDRSFRGSKFTVLSSPLFSVSIVWKHLAQLVRVGRRDDLESAHLSLAVLWLAGQNVAPKCFRALELPGRRLLEPLGGTAVTFDLWHHKLLSL